MYVMSTDILTQRYCTKRFFGTGKPAARVLRDRAESPGQFSSSSIPKRMLSDILKEHQAKQAKLREINDQNRKSALAATESVVNLMADSIGDSVADVFVAEKKLEKETKGLQTNTAHFAKQTHQWLDMMKQFNTNLKVFFAFVIAAY